MKNNNQFWQYLARFSLEWETFQTKDVEKNETHFIFNNCSFENRAFYEIMWKNTVALDDNMAHAYCVQDT